MSPLTSGPGQTMSDSTALDRRLEAPDSPEARGGGPLPSSVRCRLFAWGYGRLQSQTLRTCFHPSDAARAFAEARGWDCGTSGAWAGEFTASGLVFALLALLDPILRSEAGVSGWGGGTVAPAQRMTSSASAAADSAALLARARSAVEDASRGKDELAKQLATARSEFGALRQLRSAYKARFSLRAGLDRAAPMPEPPGNVLKKGGRRVSEAEELPESEFEVLNRVFSESLDHAQDGQLAEGYTLLLAGLRRAEEAAEHQFPWADRLVGIYNQALNHYTHRFGIPLH
jgi:hypothetical protein